MNDREQPSEESSPNSSPTPNLSPNPVAPDDSLPIQAYIELNQFLKFSGIARSGGEAKYLVDEGEVSVNGEKESRRRRKLYRSDLVQLDGVELAVDEYVALGERPI